MKQCPMCDTGYSDEHTTCPSDGAVLLVIREWAPGTVIRGKYRILAKLGQGGMGTVYKAEHIALEEVRALKVMGAHLANDPQFVRRFRQEAQAARRLRHPNIVHVDDFEQADDGSLFIAMEFVAGVSLRELLRATEGALPLPRALGIARGIAEGLGSAHALGMVHRDIKPDNIRLARNAQGRDVPKVLDFGLVAMKESSLTQSHRLLLTPPYAPPEQWGGMKGSELDGRADLYALGVTLYEMLSGQLPFHAESTEGWMYAHLEEIPSPPSKYNTALARFRGVDNFVLKLMAKDREQRPRDVHRFLRELDLLEAQLSWTQPIASAQSNAPVLPASATLPPTRTPVAGPSPSSNSTDVTLDHPGPGTSVVAKPKHIDSPTTAEFFSLGGAQAIASFRSPAPPVPAAPVKRWNRWVVAAIALFASVGAIAFLLEWNYRHKPSLPVAMSPAVSSTAREQHESSTHALSPANVSNSTDPSATDAPTHDKDEKRDTSDETERKSSAADARVTSTAPASPPTSASSPTDAAAAQYQMAEKYYKGLGVQQDYAEAAKWYRKAAEQGDANAQESLGRMYANGQGVQKNDVEALNWYRKAAEQGNASAQTDLGTMYQFGNGTGKNDAEAVKWYRKAAAQGDANAQNNLAWMYADGQGIEKNDTEAAKWFRKAAEQGNVRAQLRLGVKYAYGLGVEKNEAEAVKWYLMAAQQGNAQAQSNLGMMYEYGHGVEKNDAESVNWFLKAAEQGSKDAKFELGWIYENGGTGVSKDKVEAYKWYLLLYHSDQNAASHVNALKTSMTAGEISEAQRRADEWLEHHSSANAK